MDLNSSKYAEKPSEPAARHKTRKAYLFWPIKNSEKTFRQEKIVPISWAALRAAQPPLRNEKKEYIMRTICALTTALLAAASIAMGTTTVTTDPVGYVTGTCKANSDTIVSVPLAHAADFVGTLSATATVNGDAATIVASGTTPGWTANQYATLYSSTPSYPTYYIKFKSGTLNGKYYTVIANSANSITFDANGDTVTGAVAGDQFAVIKYWTLGELFPAGTQTTLAVSNGTGIKGRGSELMIPDLFHSGINRGPYIFILATISGTTNWVQLLGSNTIDATSQVLYPDTYFTIRHPASASDTVYTFTGSVNTDTLSIPLSTLSTAQNDNFVALQRPVPVKLSASGLSTGFVASTSTGIKGRGDELHVFDNSVSGKNKGPTKVYIMMGTDWYLTNGSGVTLANDDSLDPGMGYIIRKAKNTGATAFWNNIPNY